MSRMPRLRCTIAPTRCIPVGAAAGTPPRAGLTRRATGVFPSVRRFEAEIVSMVLTMLHGDTAKGTRGSLTSGAGSVRCGCPSAMSLVIRVFSDTPDAFLWVGLVPCAMFHVRSLGGTESVLCAVKAYRDHARFVLCYPIRGGIITSRMNDVQGAPWDHRTGDRFVRHGAPCPGQGR